MDYQNRAGSKKGTGGIASEQLSNLQRRKQVDELLRQGEEVGYTFEQDNGDENLDDKLQKNPYIYKNHSGKLVCKLCNTMHMSWTSVERHLSGKKHGLNVLRRGSSGTKGNENYNNLEQDRIMQQFQAQVEERRNNLKNSGICPECKVCKIKDEESGLVGLAVEVNYQIKNDLLEIEEDTIYQPFIRIVSGIELSHDSEKDKKYLVIAYEPFENTGIEIPNKEVLMDSKSKEVITVENFNEKCSYWDKDSKKLYVQFFFKEL
ncbi:hypothetical protein Kpol_1032p19 [Vanderwaltozyma polyspora DSM 70294]|uniref:U1-type domain-containing protein n=1 Tax=Vanderwaltozyma polyspora (strain ATCC 22028 / DSM 70294 / BCRC 21397 / CBS 2163 / NBRC 10782 / NRRL Y-8283 / UCD 57-17) TaxID=436907 RepID=A7TGX4_VANPO|nr:uncharacterized protein Kpol_1032p19 [Vanderwaltozyma polyspora DSM 70294]EDO18426.1 hypothetical protein Kpol_1032p19 [Vanderwaltozyma polyspora DSM 70294]